jgi:spoIIIJ-associated protein
MEFEDKSVEMAVKKACDKLNIPREQLKHDVISYGSTGIFGLVGSKKAKIRVTISEPNEGVVKEQKAIEKQKESFHEQTEEDASSHMEAIHDEGKILTLTDDAKELARTALQRILDAITTDATILVEKNEDRIIFNIQGGNPAVLIGKRGQTLEALQYLVDKIVNKHRENRVRIQIDVEGYLENRKQSLQRMAARLSEKVKRTGKPATMGQMNAHDRRIVHIALKDDSAVRTQSMGEGFLRKLVIFPRKNISRKRRSN